MKILQLQYFNIYNKFQIKHLPSSCRCGLRKTEKICSINNEQGIMKRGEKWFPEKI